MLAVSGDWPACYCCFSFLIMWFFVLDFGYFLSFFILFYFIMSLPLCFLSFVFSGAVFVGFVFVSIKNVIFLK